MTIAVIHTYWTIVVVGCHVVENGLSLCHARQSYEIIAVGNHIRSFGLTPNVIASRFALLSVALPPFSQKLIVLTDRHIMSASLAWLICFRSRAFLRLGKFKLSPFRFVLMVHTRTLSGYCQVLNVDFIL